jgi:hypothetical protein
LYVPLALASAVFLGSESLGTCDRILLSQTRDFPFRRLLRLAGSRWRYSTPPSHGLPLPGSPSCLQDSPSARTTEKTHFPILLHIRSKVFIEPLPKNGFRNTAVLLLRNLATYCLPTDCLRGNSLSISLPSNDYKHPSYC